MVALNSDVYMHEQLFMQPESSPWNLAYDSHPGLIKFIFQTWKTNKNDFGDIFVMKMS